MRAKQIGKSFLPT